MTDDIIERAEAALAADNQYAPQYKWPKQLMVLIADLADALKAARAEVDQLKTWLSEKETY